MPASCTSCRKCEGLGLLKELLCMPASCISCKKCWGLGLLKELVCMPAISVQSVGNVFLLLSIEISASTVLDIFKY